MSRPRRKPRTADRVVLALRDRILTEGCIDALPTATGRWRSARPPGMIIGPSYTLPANAVRLRIHAGRGRPPAGSVGLVQAVAIVSGYSTSIVARVLSGRPRASTRRDSPVCFVCGAVSASPKLHDAAAQREQGQAAERALAAVGLAVVPGSGSPSAPPLSSGGAVLAAVTESLDAAIAMGSLPPAAIPFAEQLLEALARHHGSVAEQKSN